MNRQVASGRCKGKLAAALLVPFGLVGLTACSLDCRFEKTSLEAAAASEVNANSNQFDLPPDTWTPNKHLEAFIRRTLQTEGVDVLKTKYGMQCVPRSVEPDCKDCLACTATFRDWRLGTRSVPIYIEWYKCVDFGEVRANVDVGPGHAMKAMTYWKTTPVARQALSNGGQW